MLNFFQLILIYAGIYAIMAIGQNCITGYTGMLSLCHAGFFCIGSYATAIVCKTFGLSFWLSLPVAAVAAGLIGLLIGVPTLRLKGDYLCIATLGLGEIIRNVATNLNPVGYNSIPRASLFGYQFASRNKVAFILLIWAFVLIFYILFQQLAHSRLGRAMIAVREDEVAAQSNGINVTKYKISSFVLGAAVGGIAGCLQTAYTLTVQPGSYTFMVSVMVLCTVVLGGMGLVLLHSAHASKIFARLLGTRTTALTWHEDAERQRVFTVLPSHPISAGLPPYFDIAEDESYGEYFDIPQPDELVFITVSEGMDALRSGCCFYRGKGRIFYFSSGHETYPVYYQKEVQKVILNAVRWAAPDSHAAWPIRTIEKRRNEI